MKQSIRLVIYCVLVICIVAVFLPLGLLSAQTEEPIRFISFEDGDLSYASADGSNTEITYNSGARALAVGSLFRGKNANKFVLSNLEIQADEYPVIAMRIKLSSASMQFGKVYWRTQSKEDSGTPGYWVSHSSVSATYEATTDWQLLLVDLNVPGAQYVSGQYLKLMFALQPETVDCDLQTVLISSVGFFESKQEAWDYYSELRIRKRVYTFQSEDDLSKVAAADNTTISYDSGQKAIKVVETTPGGSNPSRLLVSNIADGFDFEQYPIVALHVKLGASNVSGGLVGARTDGWAAARAAGLVGTGFCSNPNVRLSYAATTDWQWVFFDAKILWNYPGNSTYLNGDWDQILIALQNTSLSPSEPTPIWVDAFGFFESISEAQDVMSNYHLNTNNMYVLQNSKDVARISASDGNSVVSFDEGQKAMKVVEMTPGGANPSRILISNIADGYDFEQYPILALHVKLGASNVSGGLVGARTDGWAAARAAGLVGTWFCSNANVRLSYAPTTDWQWVFFDARVLWNYPGNSTYLNGDWDQILIALQYSSASSSEPTPIWIDAIGLFESETAAQSAMMVRDLNRNPDEYIVTDSSELQGALTISPVYTTPGQRVTVKINDGYTLKGLPRYKYNGTTYPLYRRVGSAVNDDQHVGSNNETNSDTFFFTMPEGDVEITATFFTETNRPTSITSAGASYLNVFGASYRQAGDGISSGLQFGSRIVRQFEYNGKTYTLQSCGTILMHNDNLSSELTSRPKGLMSWTDWLQDNNSTVEYDVIPATVLLDRCSTHVDIAARLENLDTAELQNASYVAVAYGRYVDDSDNELLLESAVSPPRSYNNVISAFN